MSFKVFRNLALFMKVRAAVSNLSYFSLLFLLNVILGFKIQRASFDYSSFSLQLAIIKIRRNLKFQGIRRQSFQTFFKIVNKGTMNRI